MAQPLLSLVDTVATIPLADAALNPNPAAVYGRILEYTPRTPDEDQTWGGLDAWSGEALQDRKYRNVTESARVLVYGPTVAAIRAWIESVEGMFTRAKLFQKRGIGTQPVLSFQAEGAADAAYTSPLASGRVDLSTDALNLGWRNSAVEVLLTWTRLPYWEGTDRTAYLKVGSSAAVQGAVTLYNHSDSGQQNWADIQEAAGANLLGVIPTPLRVEVTNNAGGDALGAFWLSVWNGNPSPAPFTNTKEAESDLTLTQAPGSANTTLYSSGFYANSATMAANVESILLSVVLSSAAIQAAAGRYFRVLMRVLSGFDAGTKYRLAILQGTRYVWFGPYMRTPDSVDYGGRLDDLIDWGIVQLPPDTTDKWNGAGTIAPITLQFRIVPPNAFPYQMDFISLLPTDSIRQYTTTTETGFVTGDQIIDDGIAGALYNVQSGAGATKQVRATGGVLMAYPGVPNRIYYNGLDFLKNAGVNQTISILVKYRPRRLTV